MRIPVSLIVMPILTAAPFAMAIRDTVKDKKPAAEDVSDYSDYSDRGREAHHERRMAEYEAEMERERAAEAAKRKEQLQELDGIFGTEKASLGAKFDNLALGSPRTAALENKIALLQRDGFITPAFEGESETVEYLHVEIDSTLPVSYDLEEPCSALREKLVAAWGPSGNGTWLNATTMQRATLAMEPCSLRFDRALTVDNWVAKLPLDALGKSEIKGVSAVSDQDTVVWNFNGVGYSGAPTNASAYKTDDKITAVYISTETDFDTLVEIRDAVSKKLKAEPTRDEDGAWVWKKKPFITLSQGYDNNRITLQIGKDQ